jgi:type IV pilus assembly protein PilA
MLNRLRQRTSDEGGFTLIELLVVILIIGILAAIAIPALLSQKAKAYDSSAKTVAQTAQTAMETFSTENGGLYTGGNRAALKLIEPSLNITTNASEAVLLETTIPAGNEYKLTAQAQNTGDEYTITRDSSGNVKHTCKSLASVKGCPGKTESSESW